MDASGKKSHIHDKRFEWSLGDKLSQQSDYKNDSAFVKIRAYNFNTEENFSIRVKRARASLGKFIVCIVPEQRLLVWRNPFLPRQFE